MPSHVATHEELKSAIASQYPALSKQLQCIARFALEHPQDLALDTVAVTAAKAGVQPSAMVRFAQALGFEGFTHMQQIFRERLVARSTNYRERIEQLRETHIHVENSPAAVLHGFITESIENLSHLEEHVPASRLSEAIKLMARSTRVHVLAQRRAFPVAYYLAYALTQLEFPVSLLDGVGGIVRDQVRAIARRELLVAISFRDYSTDVIELAAQCHDRGVPVVVITDSSVSPLVKSATVAFDLGDHSDRPFRSLVEPLCLAQTLAVSLGYYLSEQAAKRGEGKRATARS
jgi:DNA-binding MurR/RpiR family transcriptional regulator